MTDEVKDKGDIEDDRRRLTDVAIAIHLAHNPGLQDELVKTEAMPTETPEQLADIEKRRLHHAAPFMHEATSFVAAMGAWDKGASATFFDPVRWTPPPTTIPAPTTTLPPAAKSAQGTSP